MGNWIALNQLLADCQPGRCIGHTAEGPMDHPFFHTRVCAWRAGFAAQHSQNFVLYLDDSVEFAAALYGAWYAGKRVFLCVDVLPGTLQAVAPLVQGYAGNFPADMAALTPDNLPKTQSVALGELDERACELVVFTSGSTGQPTAILKRLDQLAREVEALQSAFGAVVDSAQVHGTVSHQHIYGLLFRVLWPLASGRPILPRRFFHEDLVAALGQSPSILVATPAHIKRLPDQLDWHLARQHIRAVFSSGGPLPPEGASRCRRLLGKAPIEVFGSSETGGIAWRQSVDGSAAWQPLPGVSWRIQDGCLAVCSGHLSDENWWQTQDRVQVMADGSFALLGRADRIVKIEERRVSLDALERELSADPSVAETRVLVLPGAREQLAAVIVPVDHSLVDAEQAVRRSFVKALSARLAISHDAVTRPRRWRLRSALPINAQGKVTQMALQKLFQPDIPVAQWKERTETTALLTLRLDAELKVFEGHFPQAAILPGVAQVDWAVQFGRQCFALPKHFKSLEQLKFQHVARPGDVLDLELTMDSIKGQLAFRYTSKMGVHASGRVVFCEG